MSVISPFADIDEIVPRFDLMAPAFIFDVVPVPLRDRQQAEVAFVPLGRRREPSLATVGILSEWNMLWEAEHLRGDLLFELDRRRRPHPEPELAALAPFQGRNVHLIPYRRNRPAATYAPLYYLLSREELQRYSLPALHKGCWPIEASIATMTPNQIDQADARFARAFAAHVWPYLSGRPERSFSEDDPIRVLAGDLSFWMPPMIELLHHYGATFFDEYDLSDKPGLPERIAEANEQLEQLGHPVYYRPARCGGTLWAGPEEAAEVTAALVEEADADGHLRNVIDAVRSNRVHDDFSACWSREREDFERHFYHTRSKVKVAFVECPESGAIHSPFTQYADHAEDVTDRLAFNEFLTLLDPKNRQIAVLIGRGVTRHQEIARRLGYANHSPVTKRLRALRTIARRFFFEDQSS